MELSEIKKRLVRYGELRPCKTAFIDAHTPGSNQKENFTIIGSGVSESADQHVHINIPHGFNIGAAGQPPKCRNSLHSHRTAEVFFVLSGRWRFFWGRWGTAGEVVLEKGDIINIPTGIFRGFESYVSVKTFWENLKKAFSDSVFSVEHRIGRVDEYLSPRAAIRWSLKGRHNGKGIFGEPTNNEVYIMGISHVEFGPRGIRREFCLYDEVTIWKQILAD